MNELTEFEKKNLVVFQKMSELNQSKKELEAQEKTIKEQLQASMEQYGIKSFKNDIVTISYVPESSSTSVDLKKLEEKEPDCYKGLLEDYPKVTNRKASVSIRYK